MAQSGTTATYRTHSSPTVNILIQNSSLAWWFPRHITATAWSQKYQLAGRSTESVRLQELAYMGWSNWNLRALARGGFASLVFARSIKESIFLHHLSLKLRDEHLDFDDIAAAYCDQQGITITDPDPNRPVEKDQNPPFGQCHCPGLEQQEQDLTMTPETTTPQHSNHHILPTAPTKRPSSTTKASQPAPKRARTLADMGIKARNTDQAAAPPCNMDSSSAAFQQAQSPTYRIAFITYRERTPFVLSPQQHPTQPQPRRWTLGLNKANPQAIPSSTSWCS